MSLSEKFDLKGPIKKIGVVGMGYVGIPAAVLFADSNEFNFVYGFQRTSETSGYKIEMLNHGESPLKGKEPELDGLLRKVVDLKKFECTSDFSKISELDAVTIAIQTPFKNPKDLTPDFGALIDGIGKVGVNLTEGMIIVVESTVTPGSTEGLVREILEKNSGLKAGEDFGLAHAPERVMVGRLLRNIREHDRVVGGVDPQSTIRATSLYKPVLKYGKIIPMNARSAEVTKTAENAFRDLQIAAVNQLALYCEAMKINIFDIREGLASLKGEGISRGVLYPGSGVGGHCLTKDTYHLERGAKILGSIPDFPEGKESLFVLARHINDFMPEHMFHLTIEGLSRIDKEVSGAKITILGWAFINNSDDARNTPSETYRDIAIKGGAKVVIHDPYVTQYPGIRIEQDLTDALKNTDAVIIFTGHDIYRDLNPIELKEFSGKNHPVIVDGRNIIDPEQFIKNGFIYKGIGRGDKNFHLILGK